jgi:hypothetical protein
LEARKRVIISILFVHAHLNRLFIFPRPVHDFRSLVSEADHARLRDFAYIDSKEKLDEFSAFVVGLGVKKIQGRCPLHIDIVTN